VGFRGGTDPSRPEDGVSKSDSRAMVAALNAMLGAPFQLPGPGLAGASTAKARRRREAREGGLARSDSAESLGLKEPKRTDLSE
jgi:hypothetical protein